MTSQRQHEQLVPETRQGVKHQWRDDIAILMDLGVHQVHLIPVPPGRDAKTFRETVARMVRRNVQNEGGRWFKTTLAGPNVRVTRKR